MRVSLFVPPLVNRPCANVRWLPALPCALLATSRDGLRFPRWLRQGVSVVVVVVVVADDVGGGGGGGGGDGRSLLVLLVLLLMLYMCWALPIAIQFSGAMAKRANSARLAM